MTMDGTSGAEVEGVVSRVNERGVLLEGRDGWLNVSKFAAGVLLPEPGARVRLTLDKAGFIRAVEIVAAPPALSQDESLGTTATGTALDRDLRILRQAVLNTATAILSSGGRTTDLAAVLAAAEELERWVLR